MKPPMTPRWDGWRYGRRATRRPPRPGAKRTAPMVFSSTSTAPRIFSAVRRQLLADLSFRLEKSFGSAGTACRRCYARHGMGAGAFSSHPPLFCLRDRKALAQAFTHRSAAAVTGNLRYATPARSQIRRRASRQAAGTVCRAFSGGAVSASRPGARPCGRPLVPIIAPPVYHTLRYLLEPIITQEAVVARASRLMQTLVHVLTRDDVGARALRLSSIVSMAK